MKEKRKEKKNKRKKVDLGKKDDLIKNKGISPYKYIP